MPIPTKFVALYAETKAKGELAVHKACSDELLTVSVAPHQVYGPYDSLFLPKLLETAGSGKLRIFGKGANKISLCHVDNYCHGLICGADALYKGSAALASYYVVTDGEPQYFWRILNEAIVAMVRFQLKLPQCDDEGHGNSSQNSHGFVASGLH